MPGPKDLLAKKKLWQKIQSSFNLWGPGKNAGIRELKTISTLPSKLQRSIRLAWAASTGNSGKLQTERHIYVVLTAASKAEPTLFVVTGTVSAANYTITKAIGLAPWGKRLGVKTIIGD